MTIRWVLVEPKGPKKLERLLVHNTFRHKKEALIAKKIMLQDEPNLAVKLKKLTLRDTYKKWNCKLKS